MPSENVVRIALVTLYKLYHINERIAIRFVKIIFYFIVYMENIVDKNARA